jgi:hypothetical protein
VPGIEHGLVAPEAAAVIADDPPVLAQLDPIGIVCAGRSFRHLRPIVIAT